MLGFFKIISLAILFLASVNNAFGQGVQYLYFNASSGFQQNTGPQILIQGTNAAPAYVQDDKYKNYELRSQIKTHQYPYFSFDPNHMNKKTYEKGSYKTMATQGLYFVNLQSIALVPNNLYQPDNFKLVFDVWEYVVSRVCPVYINKIESVTFESPLYLHLNQDSYFQVERAFPSREQVFSSHQSHIDNRPFYKAVLGLNELPFIHRVLYDKGFLDNTKPALKNFIVKGTYSHNLTYSDRFMAYPGNTYLGPDGLSSYNSGPFTNSYGHSNISTQAEYIDNSGVLTVNDGHRIESQTYALYLVHEMLHSLTNDNHVSDPNNIMYDQGVGFRKYTEFGISHVQCQKILNSPFLFRK